MIEKQRTSKYQKYYIYCYRWFHSKAFDGVYEIAKSQTARFLIEMWQKNPWLKKVMSWLNPFFHVSPSILGNCVVTTGANGSKTSVFFCSLHHISGLPKWQSSLKVLDCEREMHLIVDLNAESISSFSLFHLFGLINIVLEWAYHIYVCRAINIFWVPEHSSDDYIHNRYIDEVLLCDLLPSKIVVQSFPDWFILFKNVFFSSTLASWYCFRLCGYCFTWYCL